MSPRYEKPPESALYDVARQITDEILGEGGYAEINHGNPDPRVQAAIARSIPRRIPSLPEQLEAFARSIGAMRQRAGDSQRDTYTVVLGQMVQKDLIEDQLYDELIALPRIRR
jgi:hypothetical protein